jgi:hypothetical protein
MRAIMPQHFLGALTSVLAEMDWHQSRNLEELAVCSFAPRNEGIYARSVGQHLSGLHMTTENLAYTSAADGQPTWAARRRLD